MDLPTIISTFGILFIAEMGDKTQIATMILAHRYRMWPVLMGAWSAFLILNLLAVIVGKSLLLFIPQSIILICGGSLFILFAYFSWRDAKQNDEEEEITTNTTNAFFASFTMIFIAELGDKTQLAMIAMAAGTGELVSVLIGGTLALWTVALLGATLGRTLLTRVPKQRVHQTAAALFLIFGVFAIVRAING